MIDMAYIREAFRDARDVKQDGDMGVVVVWADDDEPIYVVTRRLAEALNLIAARHPEYQVSYCATAYNRNAHSLAINFTAPRSAPSGPAASATPAP